MHVHAYLSVMSLNHYTPMHTMNKYTPMHTSTYPHLCTANRLD